MAIEYTWNCRTVDTYPTSTDSQEPANTETDVIYNVHYSLTGTQETEGVTYSANCIGTQDLGTQDLSGFTAFADLTHDDVIGFVTASMIAVTPERVNELKTSIEAQITSKITPTTVTKYIVDLED
jgi:hypothetical protein|tara:strand:- start:810 stop:1184 length:375 start_codon:yes stop_codon:yes gene_type:complete